MEGSNAYNDKLADSRADTVKAYLVKQGVNPGKIILLKGWGKRKPVNGNLTAAERSLNRRVEIVFPGHSPRSHVPSRINLDSARAGQTIVLRNINFYGGSHRLLPQSEPALADLLAALKKNPSVTISIVGHVCCTDGEDGWDIDSQMPDLSWKRAQVIYHYLVDNGINKERLDYKGMAGSKHLVWPENTEDDRTMNRRVEIKVMSR